jgi:hypothetical protein
MRIIDADRLDNDLDREGTLSIGELTDSKYISHIKKIVDDQPTIFPVFSGRANGKVAFVNYVNLCKLLDDFGIDSIDPVDSLKFVLDQYFKVITELTGGFMSKLTYDANAVIAFITDRENERIESNERLNLRCYLDESIEYYEKTLDDESGYGRGFLKALRNVRRDIDNLEFDFKPDDEVLNSAELKDSDGTF